MSRASFVGFTVVWIAIGGFGSRVVSAAESRFEAARLSIKAEELRNHIDVLADDSFEGREAGSRGGRAASIYLLKQFQKHQLQPAGDDGGYFQEFQNGCRNVLGALEGSDPVLKQQFIIVGAHYDHVGYGSRRNSYGPIGYIHNGADDNASGVAGLLELIEAVKTLETPPQRSILFAFWDGEEKGLWGSKHWVQHPTVPLDRIAFAINIDMIGRMKDSTVLVYGARTGSGLRREISLHNRDTGLAVLFDWEMKENSDHHPFFANEIPVIMFHTGLHGDYHRPSDDAHLINSQGAEQTSRLMFNVLLGMANRPENFAFREASRYESPADGERLERPAVGRKPRLGIAWKPAGEADEEVIVDRVEARSPGAAAGLQPGDRIVEFDGTKVQGEGALRKRILAAKSETKVVVQRGQDAPVTLPVTLAGGPVRIGISWRTDAAEPSTAILTEVVPGSAADEAGLKVRDRLYAIDGRDFSSSEELQAALAGSSRLSLLVERDGRLRTIQIELPAAD